MIFWIIRLLHVQDGRMWYLGEFVLWLVRTVGKDLSVHIFMYVFKVMKMKLDTGYKVHCENISWRSKQRKCLGVWRVERLRELLLFVYCNCYNTLVVFLLDPYYYLFMLSLFKVMCSLLFGVKQNNPFKQYKLKINIFFIIT